MLAITTHELPHHRLQFRNLFNLITLPPFQPLTPMRQLSHLKKPRDTLRLEIQVAKTRTQRYPVTRFWKPTFLIVGQRVRELQVLDRGEEVLWDADEVVHEWNCVAVDDLAGERGVFGVPEEKGLVAALSADEGDAGNGRVGGGNGRDVVEDEIVDSVAKFAGEV